IHIHNDDSVVKGITNFAKEIEADLIALTTHGRSGLSSLFNSSIAKSVSKGVLRPVITFKI
ncbi:universal stress protein, partial [Flavobacteriaceae bacterium]|nr:universal stress protein [Flavobacteriaceae bacterium]